MGGTDDYPLDENDAEATTASALRYLRAPVRCLPLLWEVGMMGAVFGRGQPWTGPLRDTLLPRRVPMMAIGDEPRIQGEVVDLVSQEPAGSLAIVEPQEIAQQIAKKRRTMHEITIQDFDDHKLDVALRTWRGLLDEMGESSGLFKQIMSCENIRSLIVLSTSRSSGSLPVPLPNVLVVSGCMCVGLMLRGSRRFLCPKKLCSST